MKLFKSSLIGLVGVAVLVASTATYAKKPSERTTLIDVAEAVNEATATETEAGEFSTLLLALSLYPGIEAVLEGNGQHTVFAPTDAAFANLEAILPMFCYNDGLVPFVLANEAYIADVLLYHVAKGRKDAAQVLPKDQIRMLSGDFITRVPGTLVITDALNRNAMLEAVDVPADNGVIHVISEVVLPYPPLSACGA